MIKLHSLAGDIPEMTRSCRNITQGKEADASIYLFRERYNNFFLLNFSLINMPLITVRAKGTKAEYEQDSDGTRIPTI